MSIGESFWKATSARYEVLETDDIGRTELPLSMEEKVFDEKSLFDQIRDLLEVRPLKTNEIGDRLNKTSKEIKDVLKSNPYSFDFRMSLNAKVWKNI